MIIVKHEVRKVSIIALEMKLSILKNIVPAYPEQVMFQL